MHTPPLFHFLLLWYIIPMLPSPLLALAPSFLAVHPQAQVGLLAVDISGCTFAEKPFSSAQAELAARLRQQYAGWTRSQFIALPVLAAYRAYYKRFNKTYHVLQQLESVVLKDRPVESDHPLVTLAFMAELDTLLLTASHDLDLLHPPLQMEAAAGNERLTQRTGPEKTLLPGDMFMSDLHGPACSLLYGQDDRSPITPQTRRVLYVTYILAGISPAQVSRHLALLASLADRAYPGCALLHQAVIP